MLNKNDFIFSFKDLREYLSKKGWEIAKTGLKEEIKNNFSLMIPKYYLDLIDWDDPKDPLRKMVLTSSLENDVKKYEIEDPISDRADMKVPGIIHRYPDRCLLMLTNTCAVHCRFCFRKSLLKNNTVDLTKSLEYIKTHKDIWEVILSGGDPFMLSNEFLNKVITSLRKIQHIKVIRFHTRAPVVYPKRIDKDFIRIISKAYPLVIVFHINHPREITSGFIKKVEQLKSSKALLLSQSVLLKDINNDPKILADLFKKLTEVGIKPYYLYHLDKAKGTHHFRVSTEEGKRIIRELQGKISGICLPEYVVDLPEANGKIPVLWLKKVSQKSYSAINYQGKKIIYRDNSY